jgi:hypothetical protein
MQHKTKTTNTKRHLTPADLAIQAFFDACPIGYYVEHIIPVGGRKISGLHVLANLQYLPIISK